MYTYMSPPDEIYFNASHWPSDKMIRSWPLIGQPSFPTLHPPTPANAEGEDIFSRPYFWLLAPLAAVAKKKVLARLSALVARFFVPRMKDFYDLICI